ncbi:SRPBCC domain-containing protein [Pontiella agarivorans]|uniref:SRPBCC domain-containing protein n=1 Tax=Pontiella agarivorans TaxID=3038953 RepID=A0ABU5MZ57_9BACT|nr:SRPBCC domain-containing protein [Pontiella agarivorans]MDZ8119500.1 SRPBCC domain-containing protein [Pontiella agarivorans]
MKIIETEVHISASPERVWDVLTDFEKFPEWNPFIRTVEGKVRVGARLTVRIATPSGKEMTFKPTVKSATEEKEFSWLGHFLFPGLFDGEHIFIIKSSEAGCVLLQQEKFGGLLVPLMWKSLGQDTRAGFEQMNQALKERAEKSGI